MIQDLPFAGLKVIELTHYHDDRGFFTEWYKETKFYEDGLYIKFVQDNFSHSRPGVIRGLHYQRHPAQGKLVGVMRGKILDVVVDLRASSPTYGQSYSIELSEKNGKQLWIPPGFAHGFCVLGQEDVSVFYKVNAPHSPEGEGGIRYDDPDLKIDWPIPEKDRIVSPKDLALPTLADYKNNPAFK